MTRVEVGLVGTATPTLAASAAPGPTQTAIARWTPIPDSQPGWMSFSNPNSVFDMDFGQDGSLWVVGTGGVVRWELADGTNIRFTEAPGAFRGVVRDLAVGPDGSVWFATLHGVVRFDGADWTTYTTKDGLVDDYVMAIAVAPDGAVWFGTKLGFSRFDGANWITFAKDSRYWMSAMEFEANGSLWIAALAEGVSRYDGRRWETFTDADGLVSNSVNDIAVAPDGGVWFVSHKGVSRYGSGEWRTDTPSEGLAGSRIIPRPPGLMGCSGSAEMVSRALMVLRGRLSPWAEPPQPV